MYWKPEGFIKGRRKVRIASRFFNGNDGTE